MLVVNVGAEVGLKSLTVFYGRNSTGIEESQFLRRLKSLSYEIFKEGSSDQVAGGDRTFPNAVTETGLEPLTLHETGDSGTLDAGEHSPGLYLAAFAVQLKDKDGSVITEADAIGVYEVHWTFTIVISEAFDEEPEVTETETVISKFRVIPAAWPIVDSWVQLADAETEGFTITDSPTAGSLTEYTPADMARRIEWASRIVRLYTSQTFGSAIATVRTLGSNSSVLALPRAVAGISRVIEGSTCGLSNCLSFYLWTNPVTSNENFDESGSAMRVPNRDIRFGRHGHEGDWLNPQLLHRGGTFNSVDADVDITGVMGITVTDGTVWGTTPPDIIRAVLDLVAANVGDAASGIIDPGGTLGGLKAMQTDVQKLTYYDVASSLGNSTAESNRIVNEIGNISILNVLNFYRRKLVFSGF